MSDSPTEDVLAMAEHVLRTRDIDLARFGWHGLDAPAARRAVRALAVAGLLAEQPRRPVPEELTGDCAELLVRRGLAEKQNLVFIAEAGVLRLEWSSAVRGYRLTDHTGTHYSGSDDAEAAAAFNRLARAGKTPSAVGVTGGDVEPGTAP